MMKEWATVISWENGVALLRCEPHSGCGSCNARSGCGSHLLNELGPESEHQLKIAISQPLEPGQKVEVGISEGSLLRSAALVYLTPLVGLIMGGALFQNLFVTDAFTAFGAILGAGLGFLLARAVAINIERKSDYQPTVLQIGLPPAVMRIQQE
ncbi:positive regulator of sigma(E), RseC/MucC family protein [Yersinia rochesterensis]|uniref:Positive regulator of sigma(E), RseC/MucC family protein n=1 Tax=Yersinia rochesterensis TaxID=1604335 RepID=A0A386HC16_9GAMM|nr:MULTISPECIES: SoxR-reducing system protein RseC [Yersinia]AJI89099.1 sigma-E factor regulatory protein rseC [Yersinia frederiksenii Y225]CNH04944.1 SoxR reducing system protein RseC [Yersinia kristensenii]AIN18689.1 sigma-E factor regulatory protein rseC [Yersinia rochesterensis]AJJ35478.1 positive regulator of sigma(E), RseC/MucC family protein [Yersinia rochesterensis]AYD43170.1 SoxR-reducing system protein RseC [Yersinia rochesterensis]